MSRISDTFARLQSQQKKALSPYVTAGDPEVASTVPLLHALVEAGADILELGMPFSDPAAEGPVIQAAMERSLANGVTVTRVLAMVAEFRQRDSQTPIILMGYLNSVEARGYETFARDAAQAGADGVIIVDLPPEEASECHRALQAHHLDLIFLHSPTTSTERFAQICQLASGYLYYVSLKGVTGSGHLDVQAVADVLSSRRQMTELPILVGFGIKTPADAAAVAAVADGVVVGAALIERLQANIVQAPNLIAAMRSDMDQQIGSIKT